MCAHCGSIRSYSKITSCVKRYLRIQLSSRSEKRLTVRVVVDIRVCLHSNRVRCSTCSVYIVLMRKIILAKGLHLVLFIVYSTIYIYYTNTTIYIYGHYHG